MDEAISTLKCNLCNLEDTTIDDTKDYNLCKNCSDIFLVRDKLLLKVYYADVGEEHDGYCSDRSEHTIHSLFYYDIINLSEDFKYWMIKKDLKFYGNYPISIQSTYNIYRPEDYDTNYISYNSCGCTRGLYRNLIKIQVVRFEDYKDKLNTSTCIKYTRQKSYDFDEGVDNFYELIF